MARYYSHTVSKTMSPQEARRLSDAGLQLMTVFQDRNDAIGLFTGPNGTGAAQKALDLAAAVGQPPAARSTSRLISILPKPRCRARSPNTSKPQTSF